LKSDHDFRFYYNYDDRNSVVARGFFGMAAPLKNLSSIPFEKSYFVGGSNGIRAWQARSLGLGSFRDTVNLKSFNNIGDIKLEFNLEYRFKLTQTIQPALFIDMGNIWLFKPDISRPNANFDLSRFYSEMAVGAGGGLRLDFDFFIVRFDIGVPIKDPQKIKGERWIWESKEEYNQYVNRYFGPGNNYKTKAVVNFGIGFPF
jgi:outer membrane protein assembly factor BamA